MGLPLILATSAAEPAAEPKSIEPALRYSSALLEPADWTQTMRISLRASAAGAAAGTSASARRLIIAPSRRREMLDMVKNSVSGRRDQSRDCTDTSKQPFHDRPLTARVQNFIPFQGVNMAFEGENSAIVVLAKEDVFSKRIRHGRN